ncbi:glycosyltransferase [Thalassotalea montiporae]
MRILHVGKYFAPFKGGIENVMMDLMDEQVRQGHNVSCVVHQHKVGSKYECSNDYGYNSYKVPILGILAFTPIAPSFRSILHKAITAEKPDIIHIHMPNVSAFWCFFIAQANNIPWVVHWHADVLGSQPTAAVRLLYPFYQIFEQKLLKACNSVIATSPPYFKDSIPLLFASDKTCVIPLGIRALPSSPLKNSRPEPSLNLLIVGRLTYYKGHDVLIRALGKLDSNANVNLSIIGHGDKEKYLRRLVKHLGLAERVFFLGKVSDSELIQEIERADIICLPSIEKTEAFGVVLLEAMRQSKPCMVSNVKGSGMSWVVEHGVTGFVIDSGDADSWARAISSIYQKSDLEEIGKNALRRFQKMFTIERVAEEISQLYSRVTNLK